MIMGERVSTILAPRLGLTSFAYRYEGLRRSDFDEAAELLQPKKEADGKNIRPEYIMQKKQFTSSHSWGLIVKMVFLVFRCDFFGFLPM